jgi:hypothetical protein
LARALVNAAETGLSAAVRWLLAAVEGGLQVLVATNDVHWAALENAHFCQHLLEPLGLYQDPASRLWKMGPHQHRLVPLQRIRELFEDAQMGRLVAEDMGPVDDERRGQARSEVLDRYDRGMDLLP